MSCVSFGKWPHLDRSVHGLLHDSCEENDSDSSKNPRFLKRWGSERLIKATQFPESPADHECSCLRRSDAIKYRGISLLNEVDAQYSALQVKYDELLRRCHQEPPQDEPSHEEVQTPSQTRPSVTDVDHFKDDFHQPEYKELFREIFLRIQKTKEDLNENRERASSGEAGPVSD